MSLARSYKLNPGFQSTPSRGGRLDSMLDKEYISDISIHALPRRATLLNVPDFSSFIFQSTPSRGGRQERRYRPEQYIGDFNPRPPAEGDIYSMAIFGSKSDFNPRPPAEGDGGKQYGGGYFRDFNPRPPAEGDQRFEPIYLGGQDFNPRPPAEGDTKMALTSVTMIFQSTPSRGGRRSVTADCLRSYDISIHALPRRATDGSVEGFAQQLISIHALPRRATSTSLSSTAGRGNFNPRPPAEGDDGRAAF